MVTIALIFSLSTTNVNAMWGDYLGFDGKPGHTWYEAASGSVLSNTKTSWAVGLTQVGWAGIWGAQMSTTITPLIAGEKYQLYCNLQSTGCNKWVFIQTGIPGLISYGKWVWLPKGKKVIVNETFIAIANTNIITFGFGGEYGDREATDGNKHYAYAGGAKAIAAKKDADGDSGPHDKTFTTITCSGYSLAEDGAQPAGGTTTAATGTASTTTTTVATGDFTPIACGAAAIIAAAAIVVFARKREND